MATLPYFVISPNSIASMLGFLQHREADDYATPPEDWRRATVDLVIPAHNEEKMIALALASVLRQTLRPRQIVVVDDGSSDRTAEVARAFADTHGLDLTIHSRRRSIGKTVTLKREARELDSDVIVILDGDTVLDSDNYIERLVQELYQAVGVASACGSVKPLHWGDRHRLEKAAAVTRAWEESGLTPPDTTASRRHVFETAITNAYRDVLYMFLQRFVYRGEMLSFGSIINPVGCAVAYRRRYLALLFGEVEPELGDDITNSEDIFIGFAMLARGYRNVQVPDVFAKTVEPPVSRLPRQVYLWSSAFLQSCYYYDDLMRSPLRLFANWDLKRRAAARTRKMADRVASASAAVSSLVPHSLGPMAATAGALVNRGAGPAGAVHYEAATGTADGAVPALETRERRRILEPYRQAFGTDHTRQYGRPTGWFLATSAFEKIAFPVVLLLMVMLRNWHGLALTMIAETTFGLAVLVMVARGERLRYLIKGVLVAPLRYALMVADLFTLGWFAFELWISKNRKWRK